MTFLVFTGGEFLSTILVFYGSLHLERQLISNDLKLEFGGIRRKLKILCEVK